MNAAALFVTITPDCTETGCSVSGTYDYGGISLSFQFSYKGKSVTFYLAYTGGLLIQL